MDDPRKAAPMVLPNFPYKNRFTPEQVREALDRKDRILELLMDPVGPDGCLLNLPIDMMHILAFHLSFAGADAHTDSRQLIESRICRDEGAMFEVYEWRPRGDFGDEAPTVETESEAATLAAQMRTQLTPDVRAALAEILIDEFNKAAPRELSRREQAENVLTEHRELKGTT